MSANNSKKLASLFINNPKLQVRSPVINGFQGFLIYLIRPSYPYYFWPYGSAKV